MVVGCCGISYLVPVPTMQYNSMQQLQYIAAQVVVFTAVIISRRRQVVVILKPLVTLLEQ